MKRDLLRLSDLATGEIETIFTVAARLKSELRAGRPHPLLAGRTLAMIFEKPSLRTRVTFEVGMVQLGGAAIHLAPGDIRLGERESAGDIARNLERWVDLVMARTFLHQSVVDLAAGARVPVINGLSDLHHLVRCSPTASPSSSTGAASRASASPSSATATTSSTRGWTPPRGSASSSCLPAHPATSPTPRSPPGRPRASP